MTNPNPNSSSHPTSLEAQAEKGRLTPIINRIMPHVKEDPKTGCWNWQKKMHSRYPKITIGSRKDGTRRTAIVSRLIWNEFHGEISKGMCVCHACDNTACVNPNHLFLGSHTVNMRDMEEKGRARHPKGSQQPASKLTEDDVTSIRNRYLASTHTYTQMAKEYGVSRVSIIQICQGITWKHCLPDGYQILRRKRKCSTFHNWGEL